MNTPEIPSDAFAGQRGLTEGTGKSGVGDLAKILQNVRADLQKAETPFEGATVSSAPEQSLKVAMPGGPDLDFDLAVPAGFQIEILDMKAVMKGAGAASDTIQLQKVVTGPTVTDITDALDLSAADKSIVRASEIDDANNTLDGDAGDLLRLSHVDAAGDDAPAVDVYITLRVL